MFYLLFVDYLMDKYLSKIILPLSEALLGMDLGNKNKRKTAKIELNI